MTTTILVQALLILPVKSLNKAGDCRLDNHDTETTVDISSKIFGVLFRKHDEKLVKEE